MPAACFCCCFRCCALYLPVYACASPAVSAWRAILEECGLGLALALGVLAIVFGVFAGSGEMDSVRYSYSGTLWTAIFILLAAPEYLGVRAAGWVWRRWRQMRSRRYVWALSNAILRVIAGTGVLALTGWVSYFIILLRSDIWGIPAGSIFAQTVFWLTIIVLFAFILLVLGLVLFLPPAILFSFLAARRMTARVENLASVTREVRGGNIAARVAVTGEDEVAQLQADFNAMAADLEKSVLGPAGRKGQGDRPGWTPGARWWRGSRTSCATRWLPSWGTATRCGAPGRDATRRKSRVTWRRSNTKRRGCRPS